MIQNTLFFEYIRDREKKQIIEDENGFLIYKINGDECFLAEAFVSERSRGSSTLSDLLRHLFASAKAEGCKSVCAMIDLADGGAMRTLSAALKRGFKVVVANNNVLLISKEV